MSSIVRNIPYYPEYRTELRGHVTLWWFYKDFSQSHYNYKLIPSGSNACTLITVLLSSYIHSHQVKILSTNYYDLPQIVLRAFARSILEGNDIHQEMRNRGSLQHINLTIPEAIEGTKKKVKNIIEWKCAFYTSCLGTTLYYHLKKHVKEWYTTPMYKDHPDLYIIIIADQRSVLLVYQDDVDLISLFDSHTHLENGAVIAQVPRIRLKALCFWFAGMIQEYFESDPDCYELSFLYYSH